VLTIGIAARIYEVLKNSSKPFRLLIQAIQTKTTKKATGKIELKTVLPGPMVIVSIKRISPEKIIPEIHNFPPCFT
jgi:hypothetical protein